MIFKAKTANNKTSSKLNLLYTILALAWPTMLEEFMQTAVQYIDTAMVSSLGTQATAAVGATSTVNWLIGDTISALGVGFSSFISQALGAKEEEKARRASGQAVMIVIIVGLFFTLATTFLSGFVPVWMQVDISIQDIASQYFFILYLPMLFRTASIIFGMVLRSAGDTKTPMFIGIWVNLINVILNFFLIYPSRELSLFIYILQVPGAGWGVTGAAAASAVAYTFGGLAITFKFWRHKEISPKGQRILPDWKIFKPCLHVALPNMFQCFAASLGYVFFASMINSIGEIATATHTIASTIESAFHIPGFGMQTAARGNTFRKRMGCKR